MSDSLHIDSHFVVMSKDLDAETVPVREQN